MVEILSNFQKFKVRREIVQWLVKIKAKLDFGDGGREIGNG